MSEIIWAWVVFAFLNVLDGFTTWLCLYHLPVELRGREANVLYKDAEHKFGQAMWRKGVFVFLGFWILLYLANLLETNVVFSFYVLNVVMVFVVVNNSYVYISRRISKRRTKTPIDVVAKFFRLFRLPDKAARIIGFYVLFGLIVYLSYILVGAIL